MQQLLGIMMLQHNVIWASIKLSWYKIGAMADKYNEEPGGEKSNLGKGRKKLGT